LSAFGFDCIR
jgi:outer membrane receptor for ferrienterochelin and colicin